jgi:hypothetical protein
MSGEHVRIMTCRFCGGQSEVIALSNRVRNGKLVDLPEPIYDPEPCAKCKAKFDDGFRYFIGECRHDGFIRYSAMKEIITEEGISRIGEHLIFRMEKCPVCLGLVPADEKKYL